MAEVFAGQLMKAVCNRRGDRHHTDLTNASGRIFHWPDMIAGKTMETDHEYGKIPTPTFSSAKPSSATRMRPSRYSASILHHSHALLGQFLLGMLVLGEVGQAHSTQHIGGLSELDIVVADDLDAVAPGIAKIEEGPTNKGDASGIERFAGRLLVIDHEPDMTSIVRGLSSPFLQGDELVP